MINAKGIMILMVIGIAMGLAGSCLVALNSLDDIKVADSYCASAEPITEREVAMYDVYCGDR